MITYQQALARELRILRTQRGWTRAELARRMGATVSARTITAYEHADRQCTVERLRQLCDAFDVPMRDLLLKVVARRSSQLVIEEVRVDLDLAAGTANPRLRPLHGWARARLDGWPAAVPREMVLSPVAVERLAVLCGMDVPSLVAELDRLRPVGSGVEDRVD